MAGAGECVKFSNWTVTIKEHWLARRWQDGGELVALIELLARRADPPRWQSQIEALPQRDLEPMRRACFDAMRRSALVEQLADQVARMDRGLPPDQHPDRAVVLSEG